MGTVLEHFNVSGELNIFETNIYGFSRGELAPLKVNEERLAKLAQVIMLKDPKQIRAAAGWQGNFQTFHSIFELVKIR